MIDKIPLEILDNISDYLETRDKIECSTVCKHWKDIFQKSLWKVIHIYEPHWMQKFKECIKEDILKEYSNSINSMELKDIKDTHTTFQELIEFFPQVRNLSYLASEGYFYSLFMVDLRGWKLLTHMTIQLGNETILIIPENLFWGLKGLPSLVHLAIEPTDQLNLHTAITWRDIEKLHLHLPRLKYLKIWMTLRGIESTDIDDLKKTTPVNNIETVDYGSLRFSISWMHYFALKYPKLKTLRLTVDKDDSAYLKFHPNTEKIKAPSDLPCFFPCLKNIYTLNNRERGLEFSVLYNQIFKSNAKLENMETSLFTNSDDTNFPINESACAMLFTATLKRLRIFKGRVFSEDTALLLHGRGVEFSKLVRLTIYSKSESFEINNILDTCPSLKVLEINSNFVCVEDKKHLSVSKHGLRHLKLIEASIELECLESISNRCRDLKYLSLKYVVIRNTGPETPNFLPVNMQFTQLSTLLLFNTNMFKYPNFIFSTGYSRKDSSLTSKETRFTEIYLYYSATEESDSDSFYKKLTSERNVEESLQEGSDNGVIARSNYNEDLEDSDSIYSQKDMTRRDGVNLEQHIEYGCVLFQCKSIEKVIINDSCFYSSSTPIFNCEANNSTS